MTRSEPPVLRDPHVLFSAELIPVGCPVDGLLHLLDDQAHAEALAAYAEGRVGAPRLESLCGRVLVPDSLMAAQRPGCRSCALEAAPRLRAVHERAERRRVLARRATHPGRDLWARAAVAGGAALNQLRNNPLTNAPLRPGSSQYALMSGLRARRSTGPGGLA